MPYIQCGLHCHVHLKGRDSIISERPPHPHRMEGNTYSKNVALRTESNRRAHYTGNTNKLKDITTRLQRV